MSAVTNGVTDESVWPADGRLALAPELRLDGIEHVLVVAAHPDDESLGVGGLLAQLPPDTAVDIVVATLGGASHPHSPTHTPAALMERRAGELREAIAELAPRSRLHVLGLTDGGLAGEVSALTDALVPLVRGPATAIVAPYRHDGHPDHEAAARAAASAAWRTDARLLEYPIWLWHWSQPQDVPWEAVRRVDLSDAARSAKARAVAAHVSQVNPLSPATGDEAVLPADVLVHFERPYETVLEAEPGEVSPFEDLHERNADPWQVESWYERRKRALTLAMLPHEGYRSALELGCSIGMLAADLTQRCHQVVAVDEAAVAVATTRERLAALEGDHAALRAGLPHDWRQVVGAATEPVDLVVLSEVGYFLSPLRLADLGRRVGTLVREQESGAVIACHWRREIVGWPLRGDEVHEILERSLGLTRVSHLVEDDVILTAWTT